MCQCASARSFTHALLDLTCQCPQATLVCPRELRAIPAWRVEYHGQGSRAQQIEQVSELEGKKSLFLCFLEKRLDGKGRELGGPASNAYVMEAVYR